MVSFRTVVSAVAAAGLLLSGLLAYTNNKYAGELAIARHDVQRNIQAAKVAEGHAARAELAAEEYKAVAHKQTAIAKQYAAKARRQQAELVQQSNCPDSLVSVTKQAKSWQNAYEAQRKASSNLRARGDTLDSSQKVIRDASKALQSSSDELVKESKPSFWSRLVPDVGMGVAAGINPQGQPDAVAGVTLSWPL